jgi:hypothetical protein
LPRRLAREGALAAVIGVAEPLESRFVRTCAYLQEVARKAQLDFIPHKRRRPSPSTRSPIQPTEEPSDAQQLFLEFHGQPYPCYRHDGLNE